MMCTGEKSPKLLPKVEEVFTGVDENDNFNELEWLSMLNAELDVEQHKGDTLRAGSDFETIQDLSGNGERSDINGNGVTATNKELARCNDGDGISESDSPPAKVQIVNSNVKRKKRTESTAEEEVTSRPFVGVDPVPSPAAPVRFTCPVCDKVFSKQWVLDKHTVSAHNISNIIHQKVCKCGKKIPKTDTSHMCFGCDSCGMYFTRKIFLKEHQPLCRQRKELICEVCCEQFNDANNLIKHEIECKLKHPGSATLESKTKCSICGNVLNNIMMLHRHAYNASLLSHRCSKCSKPFCTYRQLFMHYAEKHPKSSKQYYGFECPVCNQKFHIMKKYVYHIADMHETNPNNSWVSVPKSKIRKSVYTPKKWLNMKQRAENRMFEQKLSELPIEQYSQIGFLKRSSNRIKSINDVGLPQLIGQPMEPKVESPELRL